jgi:BASS family bile acid:Na+ symporter
VSNFLTHFAKGNTALSISLTAFSSIAAVVLTPFNFTFWASTYPPTSILLKEIQLDPYEIFFSVGVLLGVPLVLGMLTSSQVPKLSQKISKVIKPMSLVFFAGFILMAFANNFSLFINYIGTIFLWVFLHNGLALTAGFATGKIGKLPYADIKTLSIETGIQNSGLGLVLIFSFFDGLGGMAIIAAWWGIWHLISGIILASYWKYSS